MCSPSRNVREAVKVAGEAAQGFVPLAGRGREEAKGDSVLFGVPVVRTHLEGEAVEVGGFRRVVHDGLCLAPVEAGTAQGFRRAERPGGEFMAKGFKAFAVGGALPSALPLDGRREAVVGAGWPSAWAAGGLLGFGLGLVHAPGRIRGTTRKGKRRRFPENRA